MATFPRLMVFLLCVSHSFSQDIREDTFHHGSVCNVTERLRLNCTQELTGIRDIIKCSRKCFDVESCNRVSFDSNRTCYLHKDCPYHFECNGADENHQHLERNCLHGTWNTVTKSCDCPEGYSGDRCHIHPPACMVRQRLHEERLFLDPEQTGENPFPVTCIGNYPTLVLARNKGHFSFNRTWEEYKSGFYIDTFHQWLGLENWHRLSKAGCREFLMDWVFNGQSYRIYNDFFLYEEGAQFKFNYSSTRVHRTAGTLQESIYNCLRDAHLTGAFSTWDRDNDGDAGENCAARAGSGWWYLPGCANDCNILGWGREFWNSTPPEQHLYLRDNDVVGMWTEESYMMIYLRRCRP